MRMNVLQSQSSPNVETAVKARQRQVASQVILKWKSKVIPSVLTRAGTVPVWVNIKPPTYHQAK